MTLNITLASPWMLAQTSDFRLTRGGTALALSDAAQKQIVLHYPHWSGLLCYTGAASFGTHDTGPRVQQAVQQELEAILTRLEKGLPPEQYEKVLQIMTAEDEDVEAPVAGNLERLPP
jgi:hypothetical protein